MTVLRSREVKSVVQPPSKNKSPNSKNIKKPRVSSIEPKTPSTTRETHSAHAPMMDARSGSSVRRSARLASKKSDADVVEKTQLSDSSERGVELENAVVEDSVESDENKGGCEGELGFEVESGVDVVEDSLEGGSGGDGIIGEISNKGNGEGELRGEFESGEVGVEVLKKGNGKGKRKLGFEFEGIGDCEGDRGCLRLRSGKKVVSRGGGGGGKGLGDNVEVLVRDAGGDNGGEENRADGSDLKLSFNDQMEVKVEMGVGSAQAETIADVGEGVDIEMMSDADKGKGGFSGKDKGKGKLIEPEGPMVGGTDSDSDYAPKVGGSHSDSESDGAPVMKEDGSKVSKERVIDNIGDRYRARAPVAKRNYGSKGGDKDAWAELISKCVEGVQAYLTKQGKDFLNQSMVGPSDAFRRLRPSRQQKGKRKLPNMGGGIAMRDGMPEAQRSNNDTVPVQDDTRVQENDVGDHATRTRDRFRAQARRSASKFAFFSTVEDQQNNMAETETNTAPKEMDVEMEDWPGPFSTAMKIIKERGMNVNLQNKNVSPGKETSWVPKQDRRRPNLSVPLLQELCMRTLTKNADAVTSLDYVPDVLRHKLSHMLCNMRRMNSHFLELLVRGSPTEIRVRDCSWLSEEDFTKIFAGADTNSLAVLQLDQCGRCMPDYILYSTLGRSPNCLPLLTTLSLKGACRLSDTGLSTLLSSAPALRSLNLSQCSLLTFGGMNNIGDSLGSVLRELYIDDCESIDPILMLPALSKLEYLEVLSLAGLEAVCDDFICQLISLRGHKLKELVLADCVNLTDFSLKIISKSCKEICALDLTNLHKLTDSGLGYLANGCQLIRSLKLRRNIFSDEAVAAYLETSGGSLEELSLNNVNKVAYNTAISLSRCSKNLQHLDVSFCRKLSNETLGLIADTCTSLKMLKLFGCTQITNVFLDGHSNEQLQVIGLQLTPILDHIKVPELIGPLRYSAVSSL